MFGQGSEKAAVHVKEAAEDNRSKTMQNEGCTVKQRLYTPELRSEVDRFILFNCTTTSLKKTTRDNSHRHCK